MLWPWWDSGRVHDDRSEPRSPRASAHWSDMPVWVRRRARATWRLGVAFGEHLSWTLTARVVLGAILLLGYGWIASRHGYSLATLMLAPSAVFVVAIWEKMRRYDNRGARQRVAHTLVEEGHCGACSYRLCGLATEADGTLRCPECHGAWRSDRVRRGVASNSSIVPNDRLPDRLVPAEFETILPITDERGMTYSMVTSRALRRRIAIAEGPVRDRLENGLAEMRSDGRWRRLMFGVGFAGWGLVLILRWAQNVPSVAQGADAFVKWGLMMLVGIVLSVIGARLLIRWDGISFDALAGLLLHWICPSCGDSLADVPIDADHLRTCPGWDARWRVPIAALGTRRGRCSACGQPTRRSYVDEQGNHVCGACKKPVPQS